MESKVFNMGILDDLSVPLDGFKHFKVDIQKFIETIYKPFDLDNSDFQKLKESFRKARRYLQDNNFMLSNDDQVSRFIQELLKEMIANEKCDLHTHIRFETSKTLPQRITNNETWQEIIFVTCTEEAEEADFVIHDVMKCMSPYMERKDIMPTNLLGVVFVGDSADIVWVKNFTPGSELQYDHVSLYRITWNSLTLRNFSNDLSQNKEEENENLANMPFSRLENLSRFYIFLDFLCCIIKRSEIKRDQTIENNQEKQEILLEETNSYQIDNKQKEKFELSDESGYDMLALEAKGIRPDYGSLIKKAYYQHKAEKESKVQSEKK